MPGRPPLPLRLARARLALGSCDDGPPQPSVRVLVLSGCPAQLFRGRCAYVEPAVCQGGHTQPPPPPSPAVAAQVREGADFVSRLQTENLWVVVLEKMRKGLG